MRPNWWGSETDPDPRCFLGPESNEVWTLPEWQYLRRKSETETEGLWTMDMIFAQVEKDLFGCPMIVDGRKRRREWRHGFPTTVHLHPYSFPEHGQGIYAIFEEEKLIYIGMGGCVIDRVDPAFAYKAVRMKPFRRDEVLDFEARLIRKHRPIWNTMHKLRRRKGIKRRYRARLSGLIIQ